MIPLQPCYRLRDPRTGESVEVSGSPPRLSGSERLGQLLRPYLERPAVALSQALDTETGERGTRVVEIPRGRAGWLEHCLRGAAEELGLQVRELR